MPKNRQPVVFAAKGNLFQDVFLNYLRWPAPIEQFAPYAEAFHAAGKRLVGHLGEDPILRDRDALPIVFMYRHALELYLKAIIHVGAKLIRVGGKPQLDWRALVTTHRLADFRDPLDRIWKEVDWEWDLDIDRLRSKAALDLLLNEFDSIDQQSDRFRYPIDKKGNAALPEDFSFCLEDFASRMDQLLEYFDGTVTGLEQELSNREEMHSWMEDNAG